MNERQRFRPFTGDSEKRILLTHAPLELVLVQVRWPELRQLQGDLKVLALEFGAQLSDYPIYQEIVEVGYSITPDGVKQEAGGTVFQWTSVDGAWHVSLGKRFLSLYTTNYQTFAEFSGRLTPLLGYVSAVLGVPVYERVGIRYVNRLDNEALIGQLGDFIRPELLGYSGLIPDVDQVRLVRSATQATYEVEDLSLQVRSGIVPAGETVDPAIRPLDRTSWVLDLDAFQEGVEPYSPENVQSVCGRLSDTAYDFFKLVVTDGFVREFGGSA